jgi:hypothetical protein
VIKTSSFNYPYRCRHVSFSKFEKQVPFHEWRECSFFTSGEIILFGTSRERRLFSDVISGISWPVVMGCFSHPRGLLLPDGSRQGETWRFLIPTLPLLATEYQLNQDSSINHRPSYFLLFTRESVYRRFVKPVGKVRGINGHRFSRPDGNRMNDQVAYTHLLKLEVVHRWVKGSIHKVSVSTGETVHHGIVV